MATASLAAIKPEEETQAGYIGNAAIYMHDFCLELGITSDQVGANTMRSHVQRMTKWAAAALLCARARGDNDSDMPGTLDDALAASEFLLQLSIQLGDLAHKLPPGE